MIHQIRHKHFFVIIIFVQLFAFCFCDNQSGNSIANKVFNVNIEDYKIPIDLKLSDLIDSCWLVQLETTNESVLEDFIRYIYVTNDYIIVDNNSGIYIFTEDGKFINKINTGRGPNELSISHSFYYYEKEDLIFINNRFINKDKILCYDVKSQTFQPPIKKCFTSEWNDFMIYNDSLIMGSLDLLDAGPNPYAIFFQDFKGNFISGIKSKRKITNRNQEEILQRMLFYYGEQKIHVKYVYDDTLFNLNDNQLTPYLIIQNNSPKIDLPSMSLSIGEKRSFFERFENPNFLILRNETYKGMIPLINGTKKADYARVYFLLDKSNGKYGVIKSFFDDFIGKTQNSNDETMTFPSSLPNNKIYVLYSPLELLKNTSPELTGLGFTKRVLTQLKEVKNNLQETDNPVLLIGIPKKGIHYLK